MENEFDREKSESNKQKHGIDFYEAQGLYGMILTPSRYR
jgi:uncharacterized DUF497 family protein